MLKKLVDTNIFIDRFTSPERYQEVFLADGLVYLSSVVLMELKAGAHTKAAKEAVHDVFNLFARTGRIVVPSLNVYETAGEIIAKLQSSKGYDMKKSASITNDCLIAASTRSIGAVLYTQNKKDFEAIHDVFDCKVMFV